MDRRSFLKRLGLIPAALLAAKVAEKLPEKVVPAVQPMPTTLMIGGGFGGAGYQPLWVTPYWAWNETYGGTAGNTNLYQFVQMNNTANTNTITFQPNWITGGWK